MASATTDAPVDASSSSTKTPAQLMQEQHEAAESHHVMVEDVVDEDDIQHPPPPHHDAEETDNVPNGTSDAPMSAKAAGKQKASDKPTVLDTQSEEAFPTLGASTKPAAAPASRAPGWVASASAKAAPTNGSPALASRPTSSGAATPSTPGTRTPASAAAGARAGVLLPGRYRDTFEIDNSDLDKNKSVKRVIDDVKKKYNVVVTPKSTNFATRTQFIAEGPKARVTEALMHVSKELTIEKQVKLEIPSNVSAQVIGKGGANIKKLEQQFNLRIHIERDTRPQGSPEDVRTDVVEIRGNAAQVRQAYEHISNQVKSLQPKIDLPVRGVPPEFYPFIAGRHADRLQQLEQERGLRINVPQYHTWRQQPPPRATATDQRPNFVPHGDNHIVVSGEQAAAMEARAFLEQLAEELQKELLLEELAAEQILHPYIVGDRGMDPLKFLEETGCVVILPPPEHETEDIHIIGPQDKLSGGRNLAEELMSRKHNRAVEMHKHFNDAPQGPERHSRALAQYLQQKAIEREFMNSHGAEIIFPPSSSALTSWSVISNDPQKALSARNELSKITQAYPSSRLQLVEVDPFFHPHLEQMHASNLKGNLGVHMIVPEDGSDPVVLVYEGPSQDEPFSVPRNKPTQSEVANFEKALQEAQAQLLSNIPHQGISVQDIHVPKKYHDKVRRFVNNEPKPTPPEAFPVQIDFGRAREDARQSAGVSRGSPSERVYLRGPSEADIEDLRQKIEEFLKEAEEDEKERGFTTTFPFPAQFAKNLIGKQGANIKALREKHDVDIDTRENGQITIQGPQKKAEACKTEILRLAKQWEDEVNFSIKIDPKYHGMLVGRNGENLQKIQSKVDNVVRIDFPKASKANDDVSAADNASEVGGSRGQPQDEIRIRGPRAKAEKVRDELLSLHQYLVDNSHTATVSVAQDQIASLIGRRGMEMEKLRAETGAQIDIPKSDGSERVTIQIKGTKSQVEKAKQELQKRAKAFDDVETRTLSIDRKHHRSLIGAGGSNIQSIVSKAGGTGTSAEHVRFPRQGDESSELIVKGTTDVVEKIVAAIQTFVDERENQVTETVDVPINQHRELIGPNGSIRKKIEDDFTVSLNVPRQGSGQTGVKISGRPEHVSKAKEHIQSLTTKQQGETIMVPKALHHVVSKNGALFRELSRDGVRVDHNGHKPPPKPRGAGRGPQRTTNGDMPLITDQPSEGSHSWDIVSNQAALDGDDGEIPWVLLAGKDVSEDAVTKAKQKIESSIEKAKEPQFTGYLILPDPRLHRHIIGQGGSTINSIRKASGCDIQVPNRNSSKGEEGEAITIVGKEDGVVSARDLILEEIKRAQSGRA
ncbi:hypothetical protein LTR10_015301 [Elasticomyces elasticus]|uniref:K Homology domain-containing protein n=1 Tax=Exophiala sideris TaxID=1016849 RepID=A0ABR0JKI4_9EURO|nr:hypothetical protein LTR10_015301 [Elasticomyces elasticus]KAK5030299.1 hypothetical protein LTR13_008318 [Exophiala sideris]KAK5035046.1 hypothetical protein LTS07_002481 [Exophiala sideris]KAK5065969.1 hypothetical protein LTR69_002486 [Exophiala sideris]KAK5178364.1 hypothetical protein LTR44_009240 [Eurotiomycetes sp. CCFEE 6388]